MRVYDVKIYNDSTSDVTYLKLDEENLDKLRMEIDDETQPDFIEIECLDIRGIFAVNRKKIFAFSYEESEES